MGRSLPQTPKTHGVLSSASLCLLLCCVSVATAQRTEDLQSPVERCSLVPGEMWLDEAKPLPLRETFATWSFWKAKIFLACQ